MPIKLLVADDSVTTQRVVGLTFAGEDVVIESVLNGDLAIEKAREILPDIVLADVCMPGRNGYEVCASIKGTPELSKIPVVLLVGSFEPFDEAEASRVRCDAFLTKPFDTSELVHLVRSLTQVSQPEVERSRPDAVCDAPAEEAKSQPGERAERAGGFAVQPLTAPVLRLVSQRTRESFLGPARILDLQLPGESAGTALAQDPAWIPAAGTASPVARALPAQPPGPRTADLPDEALDAIVERVVKRMSEGVIREVAWEVIPELSEIIIRQCLQEKGKT